MPSKIVRIIWFLILGVALFLFVFFLFGRWYQTAHDPCQTSFIAGPAYAAPKFTLSTDPPPIMDDGPCGGDRTTSLSVTSFLIMITVLGIWLGAIANLISELFYFIYCKINSKLYRANLVNLTICLFIILGTIVFLVVGPVVNDYINCHYHSMCAHL